MAEFLARERTGSTQSAEDEVMRLAKSLGGHVEVLIEDVDGARIYTVTITSNNGSEWLGVGGTFDDASGRAVQNYEDFD